MTKDNGSKGPTEGANKKLRRSTRQGQSVQTGGGDLTVPPIMGYVHTAAPGAALVRRVDTASLLLDVSLRFARLAPTEETGNTSTSPFAHASKIVDPEGTAPRMTVNRSDCLLAAKVTVESDCNIKTTVVGAECTIKSGSRLTCCVLVVGVAVGERCELTGCIVGRRTQVGKDCLLVDCEVHYGHAVADGTDAKGEKFVAFDGLEEGSGTDDDGGLDLDGGE